MKSNPQYKILPMPGATTELFIIQTDYGNGQIFTESGSNGGLTSEEALAKAAELREKGFKPCD